MAAVITTLTSRQPTTAVRVRTRGEENKGSLVMVSGYMFVLRIVVIFISFIDKNFELTLY